MISSLKGLIPQPIKNLYHLIQALIAAIYFGFPGNKLKVIGVTGTDGKTTTVELIYNTLKEAGKNVSMISTVRAMILNEELETGLHVTTPSPFQVQKLLKKMLVAKSEYVVLEVTSHALEQNRVAFIPFLAGLITNVSHEHLDFHGTFDNYLKAKSRILHRVKYRILNADDPSFTKLRDVGTGQMVSFGLKKSADIMAKKVNLNKNLSDFEIQYSGKEKNPQRLSVKSSLVGEFNVYNILASFAVGKALGIGLEDIVKAVGDFKGVTGRMQAIDEGQDFEVYVDFAHTPAALEAALHSLKTIAEDKVIAVFGSAGERDIGKREMMGKVGAKLADVSVFTGEDPRGEEVDKIIEQIAAGASKVGGVEGRTFFKIPDRAEAITYAIQTLAGTNDTVAIFGKGHEKSMNIKGTEYPWSDEAAARNALKLRFNK